MTPEAQRIAIAEHLGWQVYRLLQPGQLILQATAAQRAEAFLKTLGLWVDK